MRFTRSSQKFDPCARPKTLIPFREIERLKTLLTDEQDMVEKLSFEVTHWKSSAAELSKSVCVLEEQAEDLRGSMDEMQAKLSKRVFTLQQEIVQLKTAKDKEELIDRSPSSPGRSKEIFRRLSGEGEESSQAGGSVKLHLRSSFHSIDSTGWEGQVDNVALEILLSRVLAERDRLAAENDELKEIKSGAGGDVAQEAGGQGHVSSSASVVSTRSAANRNVKSSSSVASAKSAPSSPLSFFKKKAKAEADTIAPTIANQGRKPRMQVYQLSCRECNEGQ